MLLLMILFAAADPTVLIISNCQLHPLNTYRVLSLTVVGLINYPTLPGGLPVNTNLHT